MSQARTSSSRTHQPALRKQPASHRARSKAARGAPGSCVEIYGVRRTRGRHIFPAIMILPFARSAQLWILGRPRHRGPNPGSLAQQAKRQSNGSVLRRDERAWPRPIISPAMETPAGRARTLEEFQPTRSRSGEQRQVGVWRSAGLCLAIYPPECSKSARRHDHRARCRTSPIIETFGDRSRRRLASWRILARTREGRRQSTVQNTKRRGRR
jgi:hypothetical protein